MAQGKRKLKVGVKKKAVASAPSKDDLFHQAFYTDSSSDDSAGEALTVRGELRKKRNRKPKRPRIASPEPPAVPESKSRAIHQIGPEDADNGARGTLVSGPDGLQLKIDLTHILAQGNFPLHQLLRGSDSQLNSVPTPEMLGVVSKKTSFLDLPAELREPIYRRVLVNLRNTINFTERKNFQRSGQFLRVCHQVYEEARRFLYGGNSFHFTRAHKQRGEYYESTWKEIGYKDIHRFLNDIGPHNVANLRYVSIEFEDALPTYTQYLTVHEQPLRRYVNDPVVIAILKVLGKHAPLDKFVAGFRGLRSTTITDYHFLKALCSVRCREFACDSVGPIKMRPTTLQSIKELIEIKENANSDIDWSKKKRRIPYMFIDRHH